MNLGVLIKNKTAELRKTSVFQFCFCFFFFAEERIVNMKIQTVTKFETVTNVVGYLKGVTFPGKQTQVFIIYILYNVLVAQLCPTLCNSMDCSPSGSSVREILQARVLKWVTISFSTGFS